MPTDVVFFLKSMPTKAVRALAWPGDVRLISLDPGALRCGGADPLCSSAYSRIWSSLRDSSGQVMPNLLRKYARGIDVGRVAFVGFSASHGLLNPLANNDADRARIDAYVLVDATFGGGKKGYRKFVEDAAAGERLLITSTAHTGGTKYWEPVWQAAAAATGRTTRTIEARPPMPAPSGGAYQLGQLAFWYKYKDARGQSEIPHWKQGQLLAPLLEAYLVPYWRGELGGFGWKHLVGAAALAGAAYLAWQEWIAKPRASRS